METDGTPAAAIGRAPGANAIKTLFQRRNHAFPVFPNFE
jgi:hypothetical protein